MARKSNAKGKGAEELEFVFGFKQVLGLALLTALVLSGTFFWGFAAGHKRALRGEPGPFAFLEKAADPHSDPVPIPDVLLNQVDDSPAARAPVNEVQANPPSQPTGTPPAPGRTPVAEDRIKPSPSAPKREAAPAPVPAVERAAPAPTPPPPPVTRASEVKPKPKRRIHYQVAALKVRQNAKQLVDWLRSEGFPASIQPANDQGLFRVFVGPFRSDADAATARARLTKDGFKPMPKAL